MIDDATISRATAFREMVRVVKPGTRVVISDETEKHVKSWYENAPFIGKYFQGREEAVLPPADLVPKEMLDLRLKEFREGRLYCLSFRKPGRNSRPSFQAAQSA